MYVETVTMAAGQSAAGTFTTALNVVNYPMASIQVIWSGCDTTVGRLQPQGSNDGSNWSNLTSEAVTMTASAGAEMFSFWPTTYNLIRLAYSSISNTTGAVTIYGVRKAP